MIKLIPVLMVISLVFYLYPKTNVHLDLLIGIKGFESSNLVAEKKIFPTIGQGGIKLKIYTYSPITINKKNCNLNDDYNYITALKLSNQMSEFAYEYLDKGFGGCVKNIVKQGEHTTIVIQHNIIIVQNYID